MKWKIKEYKKEKVRKLRKSNFDICIGCGTARPPLLLRPVFCNAHGPLEPLPTNKFIKLEQVVYLS